MGGRPDRAPGEAVNGGIQLSSTFYVGGENNYGRYNNETWRDLESVLGKLASTYLRIWISGGYCSFGFDSWWWQIRDPNRFVFGNWRIDCRVRKKGSDKTNLG